MKRLRRQNSTFKTSYIDEAGTRLFNTNYFGFVELDKFACYIVADGVDDSDREQGNAAKLAVDTIITAFSEDPSMAKRKISGYLEAANTALHLHNKYWSLKASVTLVVTNYIKVRYAEVGNTRFKLYRDNQVLEESDDQSLARVYHEEDKITRDKIAEHEERNNLYTYLGEHSFFHEPYISKKKKLKNGDIAVLYTRGIWERVDDTDLDEIFGSAGENLQKGLDEVEDLLLQGAAGIQNDEKDLSVHPIRSGQRNTTKDALIEIEPYTIFAISFDKVYLDPNRKQKIKKILKIAIPILIIVIILIIILVIWNNHRRNQREEMNIALTQAIEYMNDNNFVKAEEELKTAGDLAKKVGDKSTRQKVNDYTLLCGAINDGMDALDGGNFESAEEYLVSARKRSRYADNLGMDYVEKNLKKVRDYINVQDYLHIGDTFLDVGDFDNAQLNYEKARKLASSVNYADGRSQAIESLERVADARAEIAALGNEEAKDEVVAADLVIKGDTALTDGDFTAALAYYTAAKDKYDKLGNTTMSQGVQTKIDTVNQKVSENDEKLEQAAEYIRLGDEYKTKYQYWKAKQQYLLARQIYSQLGDEAKMKEVQEKIDQMDNLLGTSTASATPQGYSA